MSLDTLLEKADRQRRAWKLRYFLEENPPYWYQIAFWTAGKTHFTRMSFAGNQTGKTTTDAIEITLHATGRYDLFPGEWPGRTFDEPTLGYIMGPTTDSVRDNLQYHLLGPIGEHGTGMIPAELIHDVKYRHSGAGAVDTIKIKWRRGGKTGLSEIRLKSSDMGVKALAGATVHWVAHEEHSEMPVWNEIQMRLIAKNGILFGSCTPVIKNVSSANVEWLRTLRKKADDPAAKMFFITYSQREAKHLTEEMIATLSANMMDEQERKARVEGLLDMYGAGLVFPMPDSEIVCTPGVDAPLEIPPHWRRVAGIDFGTTDGTAVVWMAEDPQTGRRYIYDEEFMTTSTGYTGGFMLGVAQSIFRRGLSCPVAWPHDGNRHHDGMTLADGYRKLGVRMALEPVNRHDASVGGRLVRMLTDLQSGRLKVYPRCRMWLEEKNQYMWADDGRGAKAKQKDHLIDASGYAYIGIDPFGSSASEGGFGDAGGYDMPMTYGESAGYGGGYGEH